MDGDGDLVEKQAQRCGRLGIVDLGHMLNLGEVIPRAEGPELAPASLEGALRHQSGIRTLDPPLLLQELQIPGFAHPLVDRPGGTFTHHRQQVLPPQSQVFAAPADTRGDAAIHLGDELPEAVFDVGAAQT
jgi:hypothetical protein